MGYRLRLLDIAHPGHVAPGGDLRLTLTIRNDGWARPYNPRGLVILLRDRSGALHRLPAADVDPRMWQPGTTTSVPLALVLPRNLKPGIHDLLIALPDPSPRLGEDPRYSIRPANADDPAGAQRWDAISGAFLTGTRIEVRGDARSDRDPGPAVAEPDALPAGGYRTPDSAGPATASIN